MRQTAHRLELRDVADAGDPRCPDGMAGCLVVDYIARAENRTAEAGRYVSARLPTECLALFDGGGTLDPEALTDEERAWLTSDSRGKIDFEGVAA